MSLAKCRYRLFGSLILVCLTELSSIDVEDINFLTGASAYGNCAFNVQPLHRSTTSSGLVKLDQYRDCIYMWRNNGPL